MKFYSFIVLRNKVTNQAKSEICWWVPQRCRYSEMRGFSVGPVCCLLTFLVHGLKGAGGSQEFCLSHGMLVLTQIWARKGCSRG